MPQVISPDGTPIAYHRLGAGPPLILVHGSGAAKATEALHRALPNSRIAVMPGQQHLAMYTAPAVLTHEILTFLAEAE